jgi:hypothetical protein
MWITGPQWYLEIGTSALDCINSALATAHNTPTSILDLPCGHGRVCRMLRASFPDAHLTVCDLDHDAVDFCAAQFNATPVYSDEDIRRVSLDQCFEPDLVRLAVHAPGSSEMAGFPWLFYRASAAGWGARLRHPWTTTDPVDARRFFRLRSGTRKTERAHRGIHQGWIRIRFAQQSGVWHLPFLDVIRVSAALKQSDFAEPRLSCGTTSINIKDPII